MARKAKMAARRNTSGMMMPGMRPGKPQPNRTKTQSSKKMNVMASKISKY